ISKDITWSTLSDQEKLEERKKALLIKSVHKDLHSDLIISYEQSVIDLSILIMKFLDDISFKIFASVKISDEEFLLFRLKNMLYFELYIIHKKIKLQYSGHILFEDIMEPLFKEIESKVYYEQYQLEILREKFKLVWELYLKQPYKQ
ncbi:MAG: hypothetical protein ABI892_13585, partial [Flavobacterium sp.]